LFAPAADAVPRANAVGSAALRILVGFMWLYNVSWKNAPDFGEDAGSGLFRFTSYAVSHPVLPPYSWVVEHLVLPAFTAFGWVVLVLETALAVLLLTGAWVRLAAALGVAQSLAIGLSVAFAPNEWPWSYLLMIGVHGLLLVSSAGRVLAVDAVRAGVAQARTLGQVWGGLTALIGAVCVVLSLGDPLDARGPGVRWGGPARLGWAASGLAALAAVALYAQLGFTDPLLGGAPTSAAYFACGTFETATRFTLDINAVPVLKQLTSLPVIVDPSHSTGQADLVAPIARAGIAAGADGLLIEVHPNPEEALSDGAQSLDPAQFGSLMEDVRRIAAAVGRSAA
jgi:hypothetical protein